MDNQLAYDRVADLYDLEYQGPRPGELEFWESQLPQPQARVLELACGSGRLLLPLARLGARMSGIDSSPAMLARTRASLQVDPELLPSTVRLHQASMEDFELPERFDLIMAAFNALLLVEHGQLEGVLTRARDHLAPGGLLVSEMFAMSNFDTLPDIDHVQINSHRHDPIVRERVYRYDRSTRVGLSNVVYRPGSGQDGQLGEHVYGLHIHTYGELRHRFTRAGFDIQAAYGGFDRRPFDDVRGQLILVCTGRTAQRPSGK